jgi:conjugal transfer pilus assembly protein TraV
MQTKLLPIGLWLGLLGLLSGCSSLNSEFDCPMKPGVMCQSLDQVNTMVDQGKLGATPSCPQCERQNAKISSLSLNTSSTNISNNAMRTPDAVARIWIAPFADADGDYYAASTVYHVIKPSDWANHPAKSEQQGEIL